MTAGMHFISGLPRSGSTLLSAILRQNPRFVAGVTSPLCNLSDQLQEKMTNSEFSSFFDEPKRITMLRGLFESYYRTAPADGVVFDTNRFWTSRVSLLAQLYPRSRVICCVRDTGCILDSIERLRARHPLHLPKLYPLKSSATVYTRSDAMMSPDIGLVGLPWSSLRGACFSEEAKRLIIVRYESLAKNPRKILKRLYKELGEAPFSHDFDNVKYEEPRYDEQLGAPGLHTVRPKVGFEERAPCIPPDLFAKYSKTDFWMTPEVKERGITVL